MARIKTYKPGPTGGATWRPPGQVDGGSEEDRERRKFSERAASLRPRALKLAKDPVCERRLATTGRGVEATDFHHKTDLRAEPSWAYGRGEGSPSASRTARSDQGPGDEEGDEVEAEEHAQEEDDS